MDVADGIWDEEGSTTRMGFICFLISCDWAGNRSRLSNLGIHRGEYMYFSRRYMAVRLRYSFKWRFNKGGSSLFIKGPLTFVL